VAFKWLGLLHMKLSLLINNTLFLCMRFLRNCIDNDKVTHPARRQPPNYPNVTSPIRSLSCAQEYEYDGTDYNYFYFFSNNYNVITLPLYPYSSTQLRLRIGDVELG